jgi:hypothetical protein
MLVIFSMCDTKILQGRYLHTLEWMVQFSNGCSSAEVNVVALLLYRSLESSLHINSLSPSLSLPPPPPPPSPSLSLPPSLARSLSLFLALVLGRVLFKANALKKVDIEG